MILSMGQIECAESVGGKVKECNNVLYLLKQLENKEAHL
jgi:hypothetical protein